MITMSVFCSSSLKSVRRIPTNSGSLDRPLCFEPGGAVANNV